MNAATPTPTAQMASRARRSFLIEWLHGGDHASARGERRAPRFDAIARRAEDALERTQEKENIGQRRAGAHQAYAPDLSRQRSESGADLHSEFVEQPATDGRLVDAVRYAHGIQRPQAFRARRQQRHPERLETGSERLMVAPMPRPPRLQPFLFDDRQRFVQRVNQRSRDRVMVFAANPEILEQPEIQVEAARRRFVLLCAA